MSQVNNQQGYALLTVLLTITIFMLLFMSFMAQAFTTVKHNTQIEKTSKSVALSEMGISYYHTEIKSVYETSQQAVYNQVQQEIDVDFANNALKPEEEYKRRAAQLMLNELILALDDKTLPVEGKPNDSIKIDIHKDKILFNEANNEILLEFTSTGTESEKVFTLNGNMVIHLADPNIDSSSGPTLTLAPPKFNIVKKPENVKPECINPTSIENSGCIEILIEGVLPPYDENNNKIDNALIYSEDNISIEGNFNSAENTQIHANDLIIGKNMHNLFNSYIETKNNATFLGQLTVNSSKLYIGGNLEIKGEHFKLENSKKISIKSSAFVRGNTTFVNGSIAEDTIMCVKGNIYAKTLDVKGELYYQGSIKVNGVAYTPPTNSTKFIDISTIQNNELLEQKCGATFASPELFIGWGDKVTNNVVY